MLIRYRFNNFCSFWGNTEFSLEAAKGKVKNRFPDNYVTHSCDCNCLKTAIIVGENAGGKSNFINSLKYLKSLFSDNSEVFSLPAYINTASVLAQKTPNQEFELEILAENSRIYHYILIIDQSGIVEEKLYSRNKMKAADNLCFSACRTKENDYAITGELLNIAARFSKLNVGLGLFITKLAIVGNEHAMQVTQWVNQSLYIASLTDNELEMRKVQTDLKILKDDRYLDILRMVDSSILAIDLDEEMPYSKTIIIRKNEENVLMKRELSMDSAGVREFFAWAVQIFRVVYENKIIFADEMDRVFNPILSDRVIAYIHGKKHHGQFIFTTHNILHLNLTTFMKEQIYFVSKDKNSLISELYALSDFPEVRYETTKIYEFYMKGILGGTSDE
ncbi:AAA family ATPase [Holdemania massiliensis]|uniref:AAA family ATPase n=1 Tax=Holdemania massiliensis TaxID=1468449 RepID=UPI001F05DA69|nr:AAA family ATPase [Holdemania massiliensis]MCH1942617.1 ATP-binding protein [Holdemania massiliensis]